MVLLRDITRSASVRLSFLFQIVVKPGMFSIILRPGKKAGIKYCVGRGAAADLLKDPEHDTEAK